METIFKINSLYLATEGEGIRLGVPQIFVRFQGCHRGCLNCDSKDTWDFAGGRGISLRELLSEIFILGYNGKIKAVSVTGGDPLCGEHLGPALRLISELKKQAYFVNIEASGHTLSEEIFSLVDFISWDFKTPSTGNSTDTTLLEQMILSFGSKMQIKSPVASRVDYDYVVDARYKISEKLQGPLVVPWVLTPVYCPGETVPYQRFQEIFAWNEADGGNFRVICQQHKYVWGPDKKQC